MIMPSATLDPEIHMIKKYDHFLILNIKFKVYFHFYFTFYVTLEKKNQLLCASNEIKSG